MKKLLKPPCVRNVREEMELLTNGSYDEIRQYILWYGFSSDQAQICLVNELRDLSRLQNRFYAHSWCNEAKTLLQKLGILPYPTPLENEICDYAFAKWIDTCLLSSRSKEEQYGKLQMKYLAYGAKPIPIVTEKEQLQWLATNNSNKISSYGGVWQGSAAIQFLKQAREEDVFMYLRWNLLKTEDEQVALIERDMKNDENNLIWYYFSSRKAFPEAQRLIRAYDTNLWYRMILVNYGWEHEFEKKFGCIANWQRKLELNLPYIAQKSVSDIWQALRQIR